MCITRGPGDENVKCGENMDKLYSMVGSVITIFFLNRTADQHL